MKRRIADIDALIIQLLQAASLFSKQVASPADIGDVFAMLILLWYALSKAMAKRKVLVSLDEDLVKELEREDQDVSAQVNQALRAELERRHRNWLLAELLDRLDAEHGPVEESLVGKYAELLGS
ncbi:MAG TPA: type II toxin-antitoxin system CcdA family antitoxin [Thermoanaerobaculia bacterium]